MEDKNKNIKKVDGKSKDVWEEKLERLKQEFPGVISENEVDCNQLKKIVGDENVAPNERYHFSWSGKSNVFKEIKSRTTKTLIPDKEESVNFDDSENIFIEGENLETLKVLQKSYHGKVKMIYIDPPYNTGNDFIYNDNFKRSREEEEEEAGNLDEEGNLKSEFFRNTKTGRYHSNWLNMMYPRLYLARNLLKEDGVIFVSIDDNEVHNLKMLMNEIFGEGNFIGSFVQKSRHGISNDKLLSENHDYLFMYAKNKDKIHEKRNLFGRPRTKKDFKNFSREDERGKYTLNPVTGPGGAKKGNPYYEILGVKKYWRYGKEKMKKLINDGKVVKVNNNLYQKTYKKDLVNKKKGATTWLNDVGTTSKGTKEIKKLFNNKVFDHPKPVSLIQFLLQYIDYRSEDLVLDFFAGSATTAHAVMKQNAEDGGNRKYIMVQLPEETDEDSEAKKEGYENIAEIGKERIRRAGEKVKKDRLEELNKELDSLDEDSEDKKEELKKKIQNVKNLDTGFRVYKTDTTNMKDVYYKPDKLKQQTLDDLVSNVKEDRSEEDLLIQVLLDLGLTLDLDIEEKKVKDNKVFIVEKNSLVACFDDDINFEIIDEIAELKPLKVVFKDNSFKDDKDRINLETKFKQLSPNTEITVI